MLRRLPNLGFSSRCSLLVLTSALAFQTLGCEDASGTTSTSSGSSSSGEGGASSSSSSSSSSSGEGGTGGTGGMGAGGMAGMGGMGGMAQPVCGNGVVDIGEECDDSNADDTDACTSICKNAACGDGFVRAGVEECDDSNADDTDVCTSLCKNAACGDGFVRAGIEECDDSNADNTDACTSICKNAACGDGFVRAGIEDCDDSNADDTDACTSICKNAACGDGFVRAGIEECDDSNTDATDACTSICKNAACGDGFVRAGIEECDDSNADNTDACTSSCKNAACGDGFIRAGVEECDDSNADDTDACTSLCKNAACGDGFIRAGVEECDDGNTSDDDACVGACVPAECGDGFVRAGVEECDDGAFAVADGCDASCLSESLPFSEDFDGATHRMSLSSTSMQAYWHVSTVRASSPANSLRCANPTTNNYDVGDFEASAITPFFLVPNKGASLIVDVVKQTESDTNYDVLYIEAINSTGTVVSQSNVYPLASSFTVKTLSIPSTAAGAYVQVRFRFDTIDQYNNVFEGVYIDDIDIAEATCGDGVVNSNEQCDDGNTMAGDGCESDCTTSCGANSNPAAVVVLGASCYAAYSTVITPGAAESACVALGGHLVSITSAAENTAVRSLLPSTRLTIGLGDASVEGTYVWSSGEALSYTNWSSGEPNNFNGTEDCSEILTSGQWNDMDCTTTRAYACEFPYP